MIRDEQNKLPIHLCRKPNLQTMSPEEYEESFREMLENRVNLDNEEREAFGRVVK